MLARGRNHGLMSREWYKSRGPELLRVIGAEIGVDYSRELSMP